MPARFVTLIAVFATVAGVVGIGVLVTTGLLSDTYGQQGIGILIGGGLGATGAAAAVKPAPPSANGDGV